MTREDEKARAARDAAEDLARDQRMEREADAALRFATLDAVRNIVVALVGHVAARGDDPHADLARVLDAAKAATLGRRALDPYFNEPPPEDVIEQIEFIMTAAASGITRS